MPKSLTKCRCGKRMYSDSRMCRTCYTDEHWQFNGKAYLAIRAKKELRQSLPPIQEREEYDDTADSILADEEWSKK